MADAKEKQSNTAASSEVAEILPYEPAAGEEYMNEKMRKHFYSILDSMRQKIMEEVDSTLTDMREKDEIPADVTDRASREEEMSLILRTRNREAKLLRKIEQTLDKIDADDYGFCESCGVEIGLRRLEARPTANLCIDCKTLDEIREKQRGS